MDEKNPIDPVVEGGVEGVACSISGHHAAEQSPANPFPDAPSLDDREALERWLEESSAAAFDPSCMS